MGLGLGLGLRLGLGFGLGLGLGLALELALGDPRAPAHLTSRRRDGARLQRLHVVGEVERRRLDEVDIVQRELERHARRAREVLRCRRADLDGVRVRVRGRGMGMGRGRGIRDRVTVPSRRPRSRR